MLRRNKYKVIATEIKDDDNYVNFSSLKQYIIENEEIEKKKQLLKKKEKINIKRNC